MPQSSLKRIAVYCGSAPGTEPRFMRAARALGHDLAHRGIGVVYGGASVGCMGALADAALDAGGEVFGVLTQGLADREVAHPRLTQLDIVQTMHERKARMAQLSDAVIALPGGYGTFDELFEALTWSQLAIDRKPIGLLDEGDFWHALIAMLDHAVDAGFIHAVNRRRITHATALPTLLDAFQSSQFADDEPASAVRP